MTSDAQTGAGQTLYERAWEVYMSGRHSYDPQYGLTPVPVEHCIWLLMAAAAVATKKRKPS